MTKHVLASYVSGAVNYMAGKSHSVPVPLPVSFCLIKRNIDLVFLASTMSFYDQTAQRQGIVWDCHANNPFQKEDNQKL